MPCWVKPFTPDVTNWAILEVPAFARTTVGVPTPIEFTPLPMLPAVCVIVLAEVVDVVTGSDTSKLVGCPCMFPVDETFKDNEMGCANPGNWTWTFCNPDKLCNWAKLIVLVLCGGGLDNGDTTVLAFGGDWTMYCNPDFKLWMKCDEFWGVVELLGPDEPASFSNSREFVFGPTMSGRSAAGVPTNSADSADLLLSLELFVMIC
jgi:hypothetical protein